MGFLDKFKSKATETASEHGDKVKEGLDKGSDALKEKTGGKYDDKIDTGQEKAEEALNLDSGEGEGEGEGESSEGQNQ
ncbi:MAG: antitoxin [Nocardioidaceae bacterium]